MAALVIAVVVLGATAFAAGSWALRLRRDVAQCRRDLSSLRRSEQGALQGCVDRDAAVERLAEFGVAAVAQSVLARGQEEPPFSPGAALEGTPFARSLVKVCQQISVVVNDAVAAARAEAKQEQEEATMAAVIAFSTPVQRAATKLSSALDEARALHKDDQSYATLVRIDHIAEKLRRAAASPGILCGAKPSRRWPPTTITDVLRGAQGRIEAYTRVQVQGLDSRAVVGRAVEPVTHALAELMENATVFSNPTAPVDVSIQEAFHGVTVTIADGGVRMNDEQLAAARRALSGAKADVHALGPSPKIGLSVVGILAAEYGFKAFVDTGGMYGGTRAVLHLPDSILTAPPAPPAPVAPALALADAAPSAPPSYRPVALAEQSRETAGSLHPSGLPQRQRRPASGAGTNRGGQEPPALAERPGNPALLSDWARSAQAARSSTPSTGTGTTGIPSTEN
ncbi:ATP-binding protein [Streptomyces rubiginosohelvolus]|uniref:ATP-binding protein n=1 Tax=Streptomyces rubiginosohelvolus TaxID=67362 RepID=UPI0036AFAD0B